jgi:hypothetical protein
LALKSPLSRPLVQHRDVRAVLGLGRWRGSGKRPPSTREVAFVR